MTLAHGAVWIIGALAIAGMLLRPWRLAEWVWATLGALVLLGARLIEPGAAAEAFLRGTDVYAFLIGIMGLAEIARREGVFAWMSEGLLRRGNGSQPRLLGLVYGIGVVVTVLLSNDTTAVVLTPAVIVALAQTNVNPRPYLYACAFVSSAASFVLPISNPANLVVFDRHLPLLMPWIGYFGLAAFAAVTLTYAMLRFFFRASLAAPYSFVDGREAMPSKHTALAAAMVASAAAMLVLAAALGWNIGLCAIVAALAVLLLVATRDAGAIAHVARRISWQIVPLVGGLFVIVAALDASGATGAMRYLLSLAGELNPVAGRLLVSSVFTLSDAVFNNLPVALAGGNALRSIAVNPSIAHTMLVAVDVGPNLCVTGSLSTLLWLMVLRREGIAITPWQFLRLGALVVIPALIAASLLVR